MRKLLVIVSLTAVFSGRVDEASACRCRARRCCQPCMPMVEPLTPEVARRALLDMMRSKPDGWFKADVVDEMAKMKIYRQEDGWFGWGAFGIKPSEAIYTFMILPRPDVKACSFEFEGTFQLR